MLPVVTFCDCQANSLWNTLQGVLWSVPLDILWNIDFTCTLYWHIDYSNASHDSRVLLYSTHNFLWCCDSNNAYIHMET